MSAIIAAVLPGAQPRDDTMVVEKMKVLYERGGVWDACPDGFQGRVGNRSRVGLALCDYGIRPGHSSSREPYSRPLLCETWEGAMPTCARWGRHRHTCREPKTREPAGLSVPMRPNPAPGHFLCSCPSLAPSSPPTPASCGGNPNRLAFSGPDRKFFFG